MKSTLYHVAYPPREPGTAPHPALILLHGRGTDENDLLELVSSLDPRFYIISVRAPLSFAYGGYTWFDVIEIGKPEPQQFAESCAMLSQFVADAKREFPIDPNKIFLFGFSMGSMMSLALALMEPQHFRGVVAHSGYLPEPGLPQYRWNDAVRTSIYLAHGELDPVVPVALARSSKATLEQHHVRFDYREYPIQHTISEESLSDAGEWLTRLLDERS